jgi:hypothetical protein
MKSFKFGALVCVLVLSGLTANAAVLNFNNRAVILNERGAGSCGGTATLRFDRFEARLILNTAVCNYVQVDHGRISPNRITYRFSLNSSHRVYLTSAQGRHGDLLDVNTFLPR